jgi:hypothetical protein
LQHSRYGFSKTVELPYKEAVEKARAALMEEGFGVLCEIDITANDPFAGYGRWVFEDITRLSGRRSFLLNSEASLGRAVLSELSRASGGATYFPQNESEPELMAICTQISLELRQQYTLGFYACQPDASKWHRLKVQVNRPQGSGSLTLSYREGYQLAGNKGL